MDQPKIPSPSPPHYSDANGHHVNIRGVGEKLHQQVGNPLGAAAIGAFQIDQARQEKGR